MDIMETLQNAHQAVINENPSIIAITRTHYIEDESTAGRTKQTEVMSSFVGRLITKKSTKYKQDEAVNQYSNSFWLLVPYNVAIETNADEQHTFSLNGRSYEVEDIIPRFWMGGIYAIQASVKELV